jgi:hypothetical protein
MPASTIEDDILTAYRDHPHGVHRRNQYDALFTVTRTESRTCSKCDETYEHGTLPDLGLRIRPLTDGTDSIEDAINRCMTDTLTEVTASCLERHTEADLTQQWMIDAAPEYLCLNLQLDVYNPNATTVADQFTKNRSGIHIPGILDMTRHMAHQYNNSYPVLYRLTSAVYHQGEGLKSGHYTAGVTSGRGQRPGYQKKVLPDDKEGDETSDDDVMTLEPSSSEEESDSATCSPGAYIQSDAEFEDPTDDEKKVPWSKDDPTANDNPSKEEKKSAKREESSSDEYLSAKEESIGEKAPPKKKAKPTKPKRRADGLQYFCNDTEIEDWILPSIR